MSPEGVNGEEEADGDCVVKFKPNTHNLGGLFRWRIGTRPSSPQALYYVSGVWARDTTRIFLRRQFRLPAWLPQTCVMLWPGAWCHNSIQIWWGEASSNLSGIVTWCTVCQMEWWLGEIWMTLQPGSGVATLLRFCPATPLSCHAYLGGFTPQTSKYKELCTLTLLPLTILPIDLLVPPKIL